MKELLTINYWVWRYVTKEDGKPINKRYGGKKQENKYGQIKFEMDWDNDSDHKLLKQAIYVLHPGYAIAGYAIMGREGEADE